MTTVLAIIGMLTSLIVITPNYAFSQTTTPTTATTPATTTTPTPTTTTSSDPLQGQKDACAANTAMEWDFSLNRCVGRREARQERHDAQNCNLVEDVEARKACHINLATTKTGVTANAEEAASKVTSGQSRSALVNGANAIVGAINFIAKDSAGSSCMSKSIFGITAMGGFVTDLWMKIQTKKKLKGLQDKYKIDASTNPYDAQVKALVYLKEEQETVKKIASQEKKRQMLLMIGYGAAAAVAAYETFYNQSCYKPEPKKPVPAQPTGDVTATASATPANPPPAATPASAPETGAVASPVTGGTAPTGTPLPPADTKAAAPQTSYADYDQYNEFVAPPAGQKQAMTVTSHVNGNTVHNSMTDGTNTYAIHNGSVYNSKPGPNGYPVAVGKPISKFDYNTGTWSGGKATEFAVTSNYSYSGGKISSGSGSALTKDISFGTGKK